MLDLTTGIIGLVFTIISGIVLHVVTKQSRKQELVEEQVSQNTESIIQLKNTAVSESHVRAILREEVQPLHQSMSNLLSSVQAIQIYIAERKGFESAQQIYSKRKSDNINND